MRLDQTALDVATTYHGSLYRPENEHDACGVGMIAAIDGKRSNSILRHGLTSICRLSHRGAVDADEKTGDGAGVLTQLPYKLFRRELAKLDQQLYKDEDLGVGVIFFPHDNAYQQERARVIIEEVVKKRGIFLFGWRDVPINTHVLGTKAASTLPQIEHVMLGRPAGMGAEEFERRLFLARNQIEKIAAQDGIKNFYIPSFSSRTISYKGLLISPSLEKFFKDLSDPDYETAICVYHQRYSTNTFPTWSLGQPFRMLAHNGEINTVRGNRNWMHAREAELTADFWGGDIDLLKPIIQPGGSDSASLDNALEVLVHSGRSLLHVMKMLVPPAWRSEPDLSPEMTAFYQYHRCLNEPWDGPAALVFTDGLTVGACLDRNGLRPARYKITKDQVFHLGSEVGCADIDDANVVEKGRLAPGEMLAIDTIAGRLLRESDIQATLSTRRPYGQWIQENLVELNKLAPGPIAVPSGDLDILSLTQKQISFGYTSEELDFIFKPMLKEGAEGIGSMGDDTPLAVLSLQPRLLYTYFSQLFAQVTNPPIDPIREKLVMSLATILGWRKNLFGETPEHAKLIESPTPILMDHELEKLKNFTDPEHKLITLQTVWPANEGPEGLGKAITRLCSEAETAVDEGARLINLSDRKVDTGNVGVPMLLAVGAIHHHLTKVGKRMKASLVCETGEARDVHQVACLIGYGASSVNPYLGFETIREIIEKAAPGTLPDYVQALKNYQGALDKGLLKIMSKMGISLISSYRGSQIFEAIGISSAVIDQCFIGTSSQVEGIGFKEIAVESLTRHQLAFGEAVPQEVPKDPTLSDPGYYRFRRNGETHAVNPPVIKNFHTFVKTGNQADYKAYVQAVLASSPHSLRNMLAFVPAKTGPVPIEEVESIEDIRRRFTTAGMSLGALSTEAHECLAIAMNQIGGKSNSGEGGEDPERFTRRANGDLANSAIKQVAAGRFGVNAAYLASAKEIEIKMAQGAKPGEGGQLPAHKVTVTIAKLRKTVVGVTLISPPPHHDIYSIEDLAQLIYDLKQVNDRARICVKLVAEAGVGTIAAGVAKAHADIILVSGHEGGTGASPLSSVKHCGSAWELGVAETHQVLMLNGLRNRVTLRTDGGMRTGEDLIYAALLGAEEYNFGTAALIAAGCVYVRQCHLNTCPVGIATQDEKLRGKFKGKPENIVAFFNAVAEEMREIMAALGVRTVNEMIGRVDLLAQKEIPGHPKANLLDLSPLLKDVSGDDPSAPRYATRERNEGPAERPLDDIILQDAKDAITEGHPVSLSYKVKNINRSVGTRISGELGYQYGEEGLPEGTIELKLTGTAGQSLGAFLSPGIRMILTGEANDYVGKGMSGGEIIVRPPAKRGFVSHKNVIVGNTVLYGASGGHLFINGCAGERFAVRNSGAIALVEGIGDHGCEYMTNGTVIILGGTGKNFGAGMTGGVAYVLDWYDSFPTRYNPELIKHERISAPEEITLLQSLIYRHLEETESQRAWEILADWPGHLAKFWKVSPKSGPPKPVETVLIAADTASPV